MSTLSFLEAIELYRSVYRRFEQLEARTWGAEGAIIELVKQVGELAKHIMVIEKYYFLGRENDPAYTASRDMIGNELADVFAQLIRLADHYQIDLVQAHIDARLDEDRTLKSMHV